MTKKIKATTKSAAMSRRELMKSASATAATAALMSAVKAAFPAGAFAQAAAGPEVTKAILGYIALIDASPLVIAKEKGFFAKHGMPDVDVAKQASWGATRDNLVLGSENNGIDGAHILTPMPYLISTGKVTQNNVPTPMYLLARLNLDAQAISVSNEYKDLKVTTDASPLKAAFEKKKAEGKEVKVAMTFPGGTHDLWIRYWLAAGGIDPDRDISTIVVPPPQMVANMKVGNMDAFCVGEPWNEQLVNQNIGFTACTTGEIWFKHPGEGARHARRVGGQASEGRQGAADGRHGSPAVVRKNGKQAGAGRDRRQAPVVQRARAGHHRPAEGGHQLRPRPGRQGHQPVHEVLERARLLSVQEPRSVVRHGGHPLGQVRGLDGREGAGGQGQPRGPLARGGKALSVAAADIPASPSRGKETFFDGKVFDPDDHMAYLKSLSIKRAVV